MSITLTDILFEGIVPKNSASFEDVLKEHLPKYLRKMKNMENGGGLRDMVISLVEKLAWRTDEILALNSESEPLA